jgi:LmbE family N-acetylglucosaminyl deacetylase
VLVPLDPFPDDWTRALCIVAHPDDMEYGAASAVARWTDAGKQVAYLLVTRGEAGIDGRPPAETGPLRAEEERRSARLVGVDTVEFLTGHSDGTIEHGLPLRRDLAQAIRRHRPELIVSINFRDTWGGRSFNMADHRDVGLAVLDAARDAGNRWVFAGDGAEPWPGVRMVAFAGSPQPTHALDIGAHLERGVASLREHRVYLEGLGGDFDPEEFLTSHARAAGARAHCQYAVAFEVFEL